MSHLQHLVLGFAVCTGRERGGKRCSDFGLPIVLSSHRKNICSASPLQDAGMRSSLKTRGDDGNVVRQFKKLAAVLFRPPRTCIHRSCDSSCQRGRRRGRGQKLARVLPGERKKRADDAGIVPKMERSNNAMWERGRQRGLHWQIV